MECPLCAKSGHIHCSKKSYSIISSATESNVGGIDRPSALAAFRLMTSSNLVDCMTGRSAGFSPLRTRPARFSGATDWTHHGPRAPTSVIGNSARLRFRTQLAHSLTRRVKASASVRPHSIAQRTCDLKDRIATLTTTSRAPGAYAIASKCGLWPSRPASSADASSAMIIICGLHKTARSAARSVTNLRSTMPRTSPRAPSSW